MREIYLATLSDLPADLTPTEEVTFLNSVLRSILQVTTLTGLELCVTEVPENEFDLFRCIRRMEQPSDGTPVEILESIIPQLRAYVDRNICIGWYKENGFSEGLVTQLIEWVQFRNGTIAHGILSKQVASIWAPKLKKLVNSCLKVLSGLIPLYDTHTKTYKSYDLVHSLPFVHKGKPIIIRRAVCKRGIWKLLGLTLAIEEAPAFNIELDSQCIFSRTIFANNDEYSASNGVTVTGDFKCHSFIHNVPQRQTDTFEGRKKEQSQLAEWFIDEDSRACLVFGDGGFGKTTLVLEFLNNLLEDKIAVEKSQPQIITFFTAKMTRWTDEGLEHLKGISGAMDECIRVLIMAITPVLSKDWYEAQGDRLIQKAVNFLKEEGLNRDDVLFVIDNTETLATSTNEVENLGSFLKLVAKKLGRVIVTSRRREYLNATPIAVKGLDEEECVTLLWRLAKENHANPLIQAGEARLRKVSQQLMFKPLLLHTLVKHISITQSSIDDAIDSVFKKTNNELLEFLYEDAWVRMTELQQQVYMLLVISENPLDHFSVSEACKIMQIPLTEFHTTFDETYFGTLTNHGEKFFIELEELAIRFFLKKVQELSKERKLSFEANAQELDELVGNFHKIEAEYESDRIAEAFRNPFAKAARTAVRKENYPEALELYDMALGEDPMNSALKDRYAWFLYHKVGNPSAKEKAEGLWREAIALNENNCDAIVNLAQCLYRVGNLVAGDKLLDRAEKLSRSKSFCQLNKAKARYYYWQRNKELDGVEKRLIEASKFIDLATKSLNTKENYYYKTRDEIESFKVKLRKVIVPSL
ncbi:ATP-binding protein [Pseudoalteromonas sp. PPB1]|uniref:ATP-binding protein n=1 Tax=Pseudoalteromonas sp. PPB1 TaxID=2756136 RepID=UPI001891CEB7|nr:ATP-binding protein [Pseudoalteromonas sp. PPB1]